MIESLLLTATRICTFDRQRLLTGASGFFFRRGERLFLATSRHVMADEQTNHLPDRIEIELHFDPANLAESTGLPIPLYRTVQAHLATGSNPSGHCCPAASTCDNPNPALAHPRP
jgi:hypothetical protein